jgi:hypothetical protein
MVGCTGGYWATKQLVMASSTTVTWVSSFPDTEGVTRPETATLAASADA